MNVSRGREWSVVPNVPLAQSKIKTENWLLISPWISVTWHSNFSGLVGIKVWRNELNWEWGKEVVLPITDIYFRSVCWEGEQRHKTLLGGKCGIRGKCLFCLMWEIVRWVWVLMWINQFIEGEIEKAREGRSSLAYQGTGFLPFKCSQKAKNTRSISPWADQSILQIAVVIYRNSHYDFKCFQYLKVCTSRLLLSACFPLPFGPVCFHFCLFQVNRSI